MSFTNFIGGDEVTETATEAQAVTEPEYWVCDFDWTLTYHAIHKTFNGNAYTHIIQNTGFNLGDIWGPLGPGTGQNKDACYKESKCRSSNDANGQAVSEICEKTYRWYNAEMKFGG